MALTESRKMKCESAWNILIEDWLWEEQAPQIQKISDRLGHLKPTKKDLMISKIIRGAACLAELTSNPKSFYNCPDLNGGVPVLPGDKICMKPVLGKKRSSAGTRSVSSRSEKKTLGSSLNAGNISAEIDVI
jgi:hypothetical protein